MRALFFIVLFLSSTSALSGERFHTSGSTANFCNSYFFPLKHGTYSSPGCATGKTYKICIHSTNGTVFSSASCPSYSSTTETWTHTFVATCPTGSEPIPESSFGECYQAPPSCPTQGTSINLQFAPNVNPTSKGGCGVEQSGDSVCTGTAAEGGYCVAPFSYTGDGIPDDEAVDDSTEWVGDGSPPDPDYTGQGAGTDGSTTTSTGSSSSTSTTTDNGDGTSTTTTTGTSTQETEETSNGTASASGSCGLPPVCSGGDPQLCAILLQSWHQSCSGTDFIEPTEETDTDAQITALEQEFQTVFNSIQSDIQNEIGLTLSGGGTITPNVVTIRGVDVDFSFARWAQYLQIIGTLILAAAWLSALFILLTGSG